MKAEIYKTEQSRDILLEFYDGVLQKWEFPYESLTVPTRFGETHIIAAGSRGKPALVLLHGAASNLLGWGGAIPEYMGDFRVIAPDIPGEAGRSAPLRLSWNNDDYVQWLDDVLDATGTQKAALLGLSFGGWLAARYAASRSERVSKIVLLAPAGIAPARTSAIVKTIVYSMQKKKGARKMKRMVFGTDDILPEISRFFDLLQLHYAPRFGSPRLMTDEELKRISCPVMLMTGGEDAFFNARKAAARLKRCLPDAEINIIQHGRHGITEYGGSIAGFLGGGQ
jgi:pimeloyl-ACP methyl ester carboxylesterase